MGCGAGPGEKHPFWAQCLVDHRAVRTYHAFRPGRKLVPESERCLVLIIGELINSTRKQIRKAIEEKDIAYIQGLAKKQVDAGANWIDVNAGAFLDDEVGKLLWLISVIREVTDAPLSIDSPRPAAVEAGLAAAGTEPLLNSISAETGRYSTLIPLVKKFHTR